MDQLLSLSSTELIQVAHLVLLLAVIILFRWVFKRPIIRLFDWKYFRSKKSKKKDSRK